MTSNRVVVTGIGVVSPFGVGLEAYWNGLLQGETEIGVVPTFSADRFRSVLGAQVPAAAVQGLAALAVDNKPFDKGALFASFAVDEALRMAGVGPVFGSEQRVGCVLGSLCAGIDNLIMVAESYHEGQELAADFPYDAALVNYQLEYLSRKHNLTGPTSIVSTACASTTDAIGYGMDLIRHQECDAVIVGGGDILAELIHAGFNALYSITNSTPRPFDTRRDGFAIGEGGGILYLESLESATRRQARIYAEISGYGLSNTAFHLTATSNDGVGEALAIERALDDAGLAPHQVDYINTHGTATVHNDRSEMKAINKVFGEHAQRIMASSNKPLIGHCMGAAGIMEAISTVMALETQIVPATPFTSGDESELSFDLVKNQPRPAKLVHAISQSFGFGGACSCVVFSKPEYRGV
ncbi:beta-ketoacyl-[acyl-carrier-protein] synthase family protein [Collimonas humicola]|uniref:beta-ketoacyl-[acyl-carrier-protein] synthase family protein n=1 Tax=Collimonas humicola TaxID=2825886 RepID=UPI001B8D5229|nr:beta-ketoacyl-[acyl-carrier-protein] synthase family protein [Collimonas humicola]